MANGQYLSKSSSSGRMKIVRGRVRFSQLDSNSIAAWLNRVNGSLASFRFSFALSVFFFSSARPWEKGHCLQQ